MKKLTRVEKCIRLALDKSIGDTEALLAFNTARRLPIEKSITPKIAKFSYTCHSTKLFNLISNFNSKSNELDLEFNFSVSGSINSSCLSFTVKGSPSSVDSFEIYYLSKLKSHSSVKNNSNFMNSGYSLESLNSFFDKNKPSPCLKKPQKKSFRSNIKPFIAVLISLAIGITAIVVSILL